MKLKLSIPSPTSTSKIKQESTSNDYFNPVDLDIDSKQFSDTEDILKDSNQPLTYKHKIILPRNALIEAIHQIPDIELDSILFNNSRIFDSYRLNLIYA